MLPQRPPTSKDDPRYIPLSNETLHQQGRRNSFLLHHLPPPVPSHTSPRLFYPPSPGFRDAPSPSGGHTQPQSWAQSRPTSRHRWSPSIPTPMDAASTRLPSLADLPRRASAPGWEEPSPGSYRSYGARGSLSHPRFPPAPAPLITPTYNSNPAPSTIHSPGDTPSPASAEHREPSAGAEGTPHRKKKRRMALSCAECAKRKQKCSKETPCQHCVARRVPELCVSYSRSAVPPKSAGAGLKTEMPGGLTGGVKPGDSLQATTGARQPSTLPTLSVRVGRLEAMLSAVVNRVDGLEGKALTDWRISQSRQIKIPLL